MRNREESWGGRVSRLSVFEFDTSLKDQRLLYEKDNCYSVWRLLLLLLRVLKLQVLFCLAIEILTKSLGGWV